MKERMWKDAENGTYYYYESLNGRIVGQVHNVAHTKIWVAKIIVKHNDENYLGTFIGCDFAKNAIQEFWTVQDRTLLE
jgi:hypothetical protein